MASGNTILLNKLDYISSHTIRDEKTNEHDLKDFQFVFIELPKFPKNREIIPRKHSGSLVIFLQICRRNYGRRKIAEKAPIIKLAYDELDRFSWNEKDLVAYEERIMEPFLSTDLILLLKEAKKLVKRKGKQCWLIMLMLTLLSSLQAFLLVRLKN